MIADRKLRFVVIDNPRSTWSNALTRSLFEKMVTLKLEGYAGIYPEHWLPVDKSDFYAIHILVCDEAQGELKPLAGVKMVSVKRCAHYHDAFPAPAVLKAGPSEESRERLQDLLQLAEKRKKDVGYFAGWTSDPAIRPDREFSRSLKEAIFAGMACQPPTMGIDQWMCYGTPKTRTSDWFTRMGMKAISETFHFVSHDVVLLHSNGSYSPEAQEMITRWKSLWDARLVLSAETSQAAVVIRKAA